jgi:hypothetical protein
VTAPFAGVLGLGSSAWHLIPGSTWVDGAIASGAGWIGDFAKTPLGYQVVSVISGSLSVGVAPVVGPWVVNVAMVTPGLVAGDSFTAAYAKGLSDYLAKLKLITNFVPGVGEAVQQIPDSFVDTNIIAPARDLAANPDFQAAIGPAKNAIDSSGLPADQALASIGMTPAQVAARFGVREDVAANMLNGALHRQVFDLNTYDPTTGRPYPPKTEAQLRNEIAFWRHSGDQEQVASLSRQLSDLLASQNPAPAPEDRSKGPNSFWADTDFSRAAADVALGRGDASILPRLKAAADEAHRVESDPNPDAASSVRQLVVAEARGAGPEVTSALKAKATIALQREARARSFEIVPTTPTSSVLVQAMTFAALTSPVWGTWLWRRWRHRIL